MIKDLTHVLIAFSFILFNADFYAYSERHSRENVSHHERGSHGLKGVRGVAFGSEEAMELLSDFKEKKMKDINALREKGNDYRSPFSPPLEQKVNHKHIQKQNEALPLPEKVEVAVVRAEIPLEIVGPTDHRERIKKNENLFESQKPVVSEIRNNLDMEENRHRDNDEDSNSFEKSRSNPHSLTKQVNQQVNQLDLYPQEESTFGTDVYEFIKRDILEVSSQQNILEVETPAESEDFYQEVSNLEVEMVGSLFRAQELLNPSQTPLSEPQIRETQEVRPSDEALTDVQSRLEALSELIFERGKAGSFGELKRLAEQWEDAEIQDYCSENPEDPNCIQMFNIFVNRPLKTQDTKTKDQEVNPPLSQNALISETEDAEKSKEEETETTDSKIVIVQTQSSASAPANTSPRVEMPLGHPDFYLPWENARVGAPRFAKIDVPRMISTSAETVPQIMARISPQEGLHSQMEKLNEKPDEKRSASVEENPFFDSNLNPPVKGPAFKTVPLTPVREIRVKYVARPVASPWLQWERFQLLLGICRPYLMNDWNWMSWISYQENQILRKLGFESE